MKKKILSATFFLFLACTAICQPGKKKVIFIIADGIPADVLEKSTVPHIRSVISEGFYKRAHVGGEKGDYTQTPTISAVGYNSLLTGTWVNKHNVWDNDIAAPDYAYPTIFRLFKEAYPAGKTAIFSTWLDNRTKLVGDGIPQTGNLKVDYHSDGYELDTVNYPHDEESEYIHRIDDRVTKDAAACLRANAPDLCWLYLEYTDDMGHRYGDSKQQSKAIDYLDQQIGQIHEAIQYRHKQFGEEWLLILTTDHGRDSVSGKNHGGQSARERSTWIVSNIKKPNLYAEKFEPAIVDIMPTIARYLEIRIPEAIRAEIDGTPLIGNVSIAGVTAKIVHDKIHIHWNAIDKSGTVSILMSTTNLFKTGGKDEYRRIITVPASNEAASVDISDNASDFFKILVAGKYNESNCWIRLKF